ncbi:MAG: hypothetical protein C5B51_02875 [Terriglobia bacterium]|nr:MAG: hypothetical protein C5B51_02875 [Terriglobia bacterium]
MLNVVKQVRAALSLLNPDEVRKQAERRVTIGLVASSDRGYRELEDLLAPEDMAPAQRAAVLQDVYRAGQPGVPPHVDLVLYEHGLPCPRGAFRHRRAEELDTVGEILHEHNDLALALARHFPLFRKPVVDRIVQAVSRENAFFAIATALPNVVPSLFELPWAFGEFASDTAFLTVNQIRMAFQIAAVCGAEVGLTHQKAEILTIGAGAFGWRAIARELAGKIPLGGGLIPKGAIAYAGTFLVGKGLERYHHAAVAFTAREREEVYREGLERGRSVAETLSREVG